MGREMWCFNFKFLFIVCSCHLITGQQQGQTGNFSMFLPHIQIKLCIMYVHNHPSPAYRVGSMGASLLTVALVF